MGSGRGDRYPGQPDPGRDPASRTSRYERIYAVVGQVPRGCVASYGQIAAIEGNSTARMVGYAMAALRGERDDVPWQRVINAAGRISERSGGGGTGLQRRALEREGVRFDARGRTDFDRFGWDGPDPDWLEHHHCEPASRPRGLNG